MTASGILSVMAWRNLWRNPRRTLLTAATISGGLALLLVFFGLGDGSHRQMLQSAVQLGGAHVAVQARGYQERKAIDMTLPFDRTAGVAAQLAARGFDRAAVVPRVFASGLASSSDGSSGVSIVGLDPEAEAPVSLLDEKVVAGAFLRRDSSNVAVVGAQLARKLKLAPGSRCVLMAQGPASPEIQSMLVRVAGVVQTGIDEIDAAGVLLPLATAQALLGLPGRIHQAAIILDDAGQAHAAAGAVRANAGSDLEVLDWEHLMPGLRDLVRLDVAGLFIIDAMFFLIIAFLVVNTLLMSVLERRREFALLDAVGLTPTRRFLLVMLEGTWIALLSALSGALAGCAGHFYFRAYGLDLRFFAQSGYSAAGTAMDPVIHSALSPGRAAVGVALVFVSTVALTVLPAWRAATGADAHVLGQS